MEILKKCQRVHWTASICFIQKKASKGVLENSFLENFEKVLRKTTFINSIEVKNDWLTANF